MTEVQGSRQFNYSLRQLQLACPTTSLIDNVPMKLAEKQRVRRFTPKTRTGCLTCKRRRVKCDERKPTCAACDKVRAKCEGYAVPKAWIFEPSGSSTSPASSAESNTELSETKRHAAKRDLGNPLHVLEPILYPNLFNHEGEPAVIMQAYLDLSSDCPMAWDTSLYRTRSLNADPVVDETGALSLNNQPLDPTPLRRQSHLALAAAMLCFCRPGRFPRRLYLTYMQSTVAEIRYQIVKSKFSVDDLLSGISQTLLACILQCDVEPTITHLRAAAGLVESCGGIDKIDPNIAAVLRYSDFHFALECLLAPVFPLMMDLREQHETRLSVDNGELAGVGEAIKKSAKTLPRTMELVVRRFVNCALALAQCLTGAQKSNSSLEYKDLNFMAAHLSGTLHILLGVYPSALSMGSTFREQAPLTESYTVCMIMWCQLLICCANETLTNVGIRMNLLPVRSHSFRNRCTFSSPTINKGLTKWNTAIYEARSNADDNAEDWLSMVDIVEEMENDLPVQISPLMRGLLAIPRRAP